MKVFIFSRPAPQEILIEILQAEEKWQRSKTLVNNKKSIGEAKTGDENISFSYLILKTTLFLGGGVYLFIYLVIYFYLWLCWVFVSVWGLSPVAASGGHSSSRCTGLSLSRPPLLRSTGSRRAGSVIVAHGPSCSAACGILPDQDSNPCPLHWQGDSQPLRHQGSPWRQLFV